MADLLPTVLRYAGESDQGGSLEEQGLDHGGWVLQRLGDAPLDDASTLDSHDFRDGEVLYLRPFNDELPPVRLDDLVDGIATATRDGQRRWSPEASRRLLRSLLGLALTAGLAILALSSEGGFVRLLAVAGCSVLLLLAAAAASRAMGDSTVGATFGFMGVLYLGLTGWLLPVYDINGTEVPSTFSAQLLAAAALAAGGAVLAVAAAGTHIEIFLMSALAAAATGAASAVQLAFDIPIGAASAAIAALAVIFGAFIPAISFKFAGMRMPALPTNPQQLQEGIDPYDTGDVTARTARAAVWMTALYGGTAMVCIGCLTALVLHGGTPAMWTATVLTALLLLHGRGMVNVWNRLSSSLPVLGESAFSSWPGHNPSRQKSASSWCWH
ncbi:type VII secretion integral membrane protein EccD [Streptomyces zhihengii]